MTETGALVKTLESGKGPPCSKVCPLFAHHLSSPILHPHLSFIFIFYLFIDAILSIPLGIITGVSIYIQSYRKGAQVKHQYYRSDTSESFKVCVIKKMQVKKQSIHD